MRVKNHPILSFKERETVTFTYEGEKVTARKGETIAAALHNHGVTELRKSGEEERPRGLFCAIGKCSSCLMTVDGVPNVRTCITAVREGMKVKKQTGLPGLKDNSDRLTPKAIKTETTDVLVIGGGPAGLKAALIAANAGAEVAIVDENPFLGGQLIKQTHKFFGSSEQEAGTRGTEICDKLVRQVKETEEIEIMTETSSVGIYDDTVGLYKNREKFFKINPKKIIMSTGANEDMIGFPGNDLPGVYGAGGIQTMMNVYGIKPGDRVLMVGAGNVGLIVTYQLLQADVDVEAVVEVAPQIGGYFVHAAKISRFGVPILTEHKVLNVKGEDKVKKASIVKIDESGNELPSTRKEYNVDTVALAVGLSPSYKLLAHAGCELEYVQELGGHVPLRDNAMKTSEADIYAAGDAAGIEEATAAMLEGSIAGADAALNLGFGGSNEKEIIGDSRNRLKALRAGPDCEDLRRGLRKVRI